jgi:hypothetical protein
VSAVRPAAANLGRDETILERDGRDETGLERDGRDETRLERLDRNTIELLNELRVAGTGIQVLLAFLLVAPFDSTTASSSASIKSLTCCESGTRR